MVRPAPILALFLLTTTALAQSEYRLDGSGAWTQASAAPLSADEQVIAEARALLASGQAKRARKKLERWLEDHEATTHPLLPQAHLVKGDAVLAEGDEFQALYDYEAVILGYPGTPEFVTAVERELEIGIKYIHGMKRKWLGLRTAAAQPIGEELLVRVQERLPGSRTAERAALELADYYYRTRDLRMAGDAYEIFATNFPRSEHIGKARERRIYAAIGRFKGPDYDAAALTDARVLIEDYEEVDPVAARRAGLSDGLVARLDESAAAQLLQRARWYLKRSDPVSARFVLRRVVAKHPQTVAAQTALDMLEERGWTVSSAPAPPAQGAPAALPEAPAEEQP